MTPQEMADARFPQERIDDLAEERAASGDDVDLDWLADDEERRIWRGFGE